MKLNYIKISMGLLTPNLVYGALLDENESVMLESVKGGIYSYLGFYPFATFKSKKKRIVFKQNGKSKKIYGNPFQELKKLIESYKIQEIENLPFSSGCMGYFGYDLAHFIEKLPCTTKDDLGLPDCYLIFPSLVFVFDHVKKYVYIIGINKDKKKLDRIINNIVKKINVLRKEKEELNHEIAKNRIKVKFSDVKSNFSFLDYIKTIKRCKHYIKEGDSFQIKLSQRLEEETNFNSYKLYQILREINPAPYSAYLKFNDFQIVSCSPEHFLKVDRQNVLTKPIGGTYPNITLNTNKILIDKFKKDEKELAEHIMLIDMERNDLGRVCTFGSVKVSKLMDIEVYSDVIHIVTTIEGILKENADCFDAIKAMFPGGTITGCPKIRTMEIINELEPTQRGPYTGSIGFISFAKNLDLNLIIRTAIVKKDKTYIHVGGGIVADSNPKKEYYETLYKGKSLLEAIQIARKIK